MSFKIVRNDITKMNTEAIVHSANAEPVVGLGCDDAVYQAAGYEQLLSYRKEHIGWVEEGEAFITPGFHLQAKYIIHAVCPLYRNGTQGEEDKLRSCYQKSLQIAKEKKIRSLAVLLISTGSPGFQKEESMRIAVDEIKAFLAQNDMQIFLVVFDSKEELPERKIHSELEKYITCNYVEPMTCARVEKQRSAKLETPALFKGQAKAATCDFLLQETVEESREWDFEEKHESRLNERMKHISDTFSQYLLYLIRERNMENAEVYKRAIVDKKIFSKIKNNPNYHPQKLTALCLCIGAKLNLDETKDLLARAGYALSPCDKTDIIFSYFIENEIYDMIELDIQLEEHGLACIIS